MTSAMLAAALTMLSSLGCSQKSDVGSSQGSAEGSAQVRSATRRLPKDDLVAVPEGDYKTSEPSFAPDEHGACSASTVARVAELMRAQWPDALAHVPAYSIDRVVTSCGDFDSCVNQGGCGRPRKDVDYSCLYGTANVSLPYAVQYCAWRSMRLPTLTEWQVAFRGTSSRLDAECGNTTEGPAGQRCKYKSDFGVIGHFASFHNKEFTRASGCFPPNDAGSGADIGVRSQPILASGASTALYLFTKRERDDATGQFRCVRDQSVLVP